MQSLKRSVLAIAVLAAALWSVPGAAFAQAEEIRSADQVRTAFGAAGYEVGEPHTWGWMQPAYTSFRIADAATDRVWTVVVYAGTASADQARLQAAHGQLQYATTSDGPRLAVGFGPSVWSGNVAIVQTTESRLDSLYRLQSARDNGVYDAVDPTVERPIDTVDLDFQNALQRSATNF